MQHEEPTMTDVLNRIDGLHQAMDTRFTGLEKEIKAGFEGVEEDFAAVNEEFNVIREKLDTLDGRLTGVETRLTGVETRLTGVESTMVDKPYLDRALADLKTDLTADMRQQDKKTNLLIDAIERNKVISAKEAGAIRSAGPFSSLHPR
ncbi:hypothetical protein HY633_00105 [Candidatus Uhrbacteria bacterium]|nr:hypothetical protein [Candidatus Uhrbacteria bacterium]